MRFGVMTPHFLDLASPTNIRVIARAAEELGFDSIWTSDHIAIVPPIQARFGQIWYEATSVLGYLAGITEKIRLGISALILPYRNPVITAKALAGIDSLSGGRLIVGASSGWCEEEFAALGVPFRQRGALSDEALRLMRELWTSDAPSSNVERYRFEKMAFFPKPVQQPHPPLWIGGNSARGLARAIEFGTAWHLAASGVAEATQARRSLTDALRAAGRSPDEVELTLRLPLQVLTAEEADGVAPFGAGAHPRAELRDQIFSGGEINEVSLVGTAETIARRLKLYRDAGVTCVVFDTFYSLPNLREQGIEAVLRTMRRFVEEVQPAL